MPLPRTLVAAALSIWSLVFAGSARAATAVACVGDSITEGSGWPAKLGTKLGAEFSVMNYGVSGTYTVTGADGNSFRAEGVLNFHFQGRPAACGGTILSAQPFSLIGTRSEGRAVSFTIHTSGAGDGSTYAEGPPPGPLDCTAKVVNFITEGTGTRNP